ncbi:hypothetical protein PDK10_09055 [Bacillus cereus]|nr:hypothetical protein [Bacillus cereus]
MKKRKRLWNLWKTITLLVCTVVIFSLLVTDILISHNVERTTEDSQAEKAKTIAHIVANDSIVIDGLIGKADTSAIQTYTNRILKNTGVQFIVVMDMNGIRKSHPNPQKIGHHFIGGDEGPALKGKEHVSLAEGTLGISMRVFVPVFSETGEQLGAVAVGISAVHDMGSIKKALQYGVVDYLIKPFTFERFKEALTIYREKLTFMKEQQKISQSELDSLILQKEKREPTVTKELPKGLTKQTLQLIWQKIESLNGRAFTTDEMSQLVGISRVSIRKYVMFLTDIGVLENEMMYQHVGRPVSKLRCVDQKKIEFYV